MHSPNQDPAGLPATPYVAGGGRPLGTAALVGDAQADIVVVGGGIAGSSLALHAAEAGARVVLLEAKDIGWGASSRNSGHVAPATKQEPQDILRIHAPPYGERILEAARQGPDLVFSLAEKYGMDAAVARTGVISAAHTHASLEILRRRTEFLRARGYRVDFLTRTETAEAIGNDARYYFGCSVDHHGGTLNPLAYVRGLARAAVAGGARIHERSPATALTQERRKWRVATPAGAVTADFVALCTNAYTGDLWPGLKRSIVPVRAYQFMTTPLGANLRRTVLPGRQGLTDMRRLMSGIRMYEDGRLLFSGQGPLFGTEREPFLEASLRRIRSTFPQIDGAGVDQWWSGWMAMNFENSWKIHELAPGLVTALGCNGRGVAIATTLGRELAAFMQGKPAADLIMPFVSVAPIRVYGFHRPLVRALVSYYKVRDAMDTLQARKAAH